MKKTTVYLPEDVKRALERTAANRGVSEAEVVRDAVRAAVAADHPRPRAGLFAGTEPIANRVDELLVGFGER